MYKIGIIGATGYTASELIKILVKHPQVEITYLGSNSHAGKKIQEVAPELQGIIDQPLADYQQLTQEKLDLVFLTLPHAVAMDQVKEVWDKSTFKIIDLSADFRFKDQAVYEKYYKPHVMAQLLPEVAYGLPEINDRQVITKARLVANPGCYVTAATLGLFPIVKTGECLPGSIIVDAKSGYSGAGRSFSQEFQQGSGDRFKAYKIAEHRHQPEIEQNIGEKVVFVPHLLPVFRGILSTCYVSFKENSNLTTERIKQLYLDQYANESFVCLVDSPPDISQVNETNKCLIWYKFLAEEKKLIIVSVIDNLVKGASGQAVQNMNLMLGIEETTGLL